VTSRTARAENGRLAEAQSSDGEIGLTAQSQYTTRPCDKKSRKIKIVIDPSPPPADLAERLARIFQTAIDAARRYDRENGRAA
jgi:hypothetical protein